MAALVILALVGMAVLVLLALGLDAFLLGLFRRQTGRLVRGLAVMLAALVVLTGVATYGVIKAASHTARAASRAGASVRQAAATGAKVAFGVAAHAASQVMSQAGTWEDDPKNWERAFQSLKPDDVEVLHSRYWRSAHWTYEFDYSFEIEANETLQKQLFAENKLTQLSAEIVAQEDRPSSPPWFAPKPVDCYEIWAYEDYATAGGHFRVFIDKETGHLFLTDWQL